MNGCWILSNAFFVCLIFMDDYFFLSYINVLYYLDLPCWTIFVICPLTFKVIIDRYAFIDIVILILQFFWGSSLFISFLFGLIFFCSVFKSLSFWFLWSIVFDLWFPWASRIMTHNYIYFKLIGYVLPCLTDVQTLIYICLSWCGFFFPIYSFILSPWNYIRDEYQKILYNNSLTYFQVQCGIF